MHPSTGPIRGGLLMLGAMSLLSMGCGPDRNDAFGPVPHGVAPAGGTAVNGIEREWVIGLDIADVKAGPITFTMKNTGTVTHEMLFVRTDLPVGSFPVDHSTGLFDEDASATKVFTEISEFEPGQTKSLTVNLPAGTYQLVCNLAKHYTSGMAVTFKVHA